MKRIATALFVITLASSVAAEARVKLQDDAAIENGLVIVAVGNVLRKSCEDISPRLWKAYSYAQSLQKRARDLGYSSAEIDAYLDSDPDKSRVKAKARAYLEARGANMADTASICAVGRAEIASGTQIGQLLKAR